MNWFSATARLAFRARQAAARETWTAASNGSLAVAVFRRPQRLLGSTGSTSSSSCSSEHRIAGTARATAGYTCFNRTLTGKLESPRRAPNARMTRHGRAFPSHLSHALDPATSHHCGFDVKGPGHSVDGKFLRSKATTQCQAVVRTRTFVSTSLTKTHKNHSLPLWVRVNSFPTVTL